jgi:hypothetical protein
MSVLSDPVRFRKTIAGLALIGAPLAGFVSCLTDSSEGIGQPGASLYATAAAHGGGIWVTGLIFMVSAILTVPAALGLAHLLRARGAALGHLGAACLITGAFGHMGYAVWQLMLSRAAGPGVPRMELSVAGAFPGAVVSANPRRRAATEPRRCHIVGVRTATESHRCGCTWSLRPVA